jgi:hypothetical protein
MQERPELVPGGTIDHVLQHEVKELGTHIRVLCRSGQSWCQRGTIDHVLQHEVKELGTHILVLCRSGQSLCPGGLLIMCYSTR